VTARRLNIKSKFKEGPHLIASLRDFEFTEGDTIDPDAIVGNPQVSLYCLDDERRDAIFVEHSIDLDLTKAAFVNQTQHENARSLIAVPFETFARIGESFPEVSEPIFIYNIGRVGSTLLSHVFNDTNLVMCLSEPDAIDHLVPMRDQTGGDRDGELRELAQSTVRILFKNDRTHKRYALKFRSQGHRVMDLLQVAFPDAQNIFLYRDPVGFVASLYRLIKQNLDPPEYATFDEWRSFYTKFRCLSLDSK